MPPPIPKRVKRKEISKQDSVLQEISECSPPLQEIARQDSLLQELSVCAPPIQETPRQDSILQSSTEKVKAHCNRHLFILSIKIIITNFSKPLQDLQESLELSRILFYKRNPNNWMLFYKI